MKKHTKKIPVPNNEQALQAARKTNAVASSKKLYTDARELTGMSSGQRISVMMAAKQLVKVVTLIANQNTAN